MARDADIEKWQEWYYQALSMTDEGEKRTRLSENGTTA